MLHVAVNRSGPISPFSVPATVAADAAEIEAALKAAAASAPELNTPTRFYGVLVRLFIAVAQFYAVFSRGVLIVSKSALAVGLLIALCQAVTPARSNA